MLIRQSSTLLLGAASIVQGFEQAAPFFMVASQPLKHISLSSKQIAAAHDVEAGVLGSIANCEHKFYFVVSQPGVTAADIRDETSLPRIRERVGKAEAGAVVDIPEVMGEIDARRLADRIGHLCGLDVEETAISNAQSQQFGLNGKSAVVRLHGEHVAEDKKRAAGLAVQDAQLDSFINNVTDHKAPYVVIFTTAPETKHEPPAYEMDEQYTELHTDLKRHIETRQVKRQNGTDDAQAGLPLFERYQFLSPAIFMGLSVSVLLFLILYVAISAIAGVEVSYMAFSNEMGKQAQKSKQ